MTSERTKAICPKCRGERNAFIRGEHSTSWEDEQYGINGSNTGYILECGGCETLFFKEEVYFSENGSYYHDPITGQDKYDPELDIIYYPPASKRERPEWLRSVALQDDTLGQLLNYHQLQQTIE